MFKVHTGDLPEKQFVCVTGSLWELGEWVVEKSLKLNKKENGLVCVCVCVCVVCVYVFMCLCLFFNYC